MSPRAPTAVPTARAFDPNRLRTLREEWRSLARSQGPELARFADHALQSPPWPGVFTGIFGASPYLTDLVMKSPGLVMEVAERGPDVPLARVTAMLARPERDVTATAKHLRVAKADAALVIALADLGALWDVDRVTSALSDFADACLAHALRALLTQAHAQGQLALADPATPDIGSGYAVIGLGKLGGRELNYSSDIDLFVFFDEARLPYVGSKSPQEFAVALTKDLMRLMQERNAGGYVFRTDLRLRPDPGSTSIAVSRAAAQSYYESYGQNWERAAFIKARAIAGDVALGQAFLRDLQPFIWRTSLDFYAIQDIHSIKRQIYAHKGGGRVQVLGHNIKLGRGGIREIEFFAQVQQLIWGGRFPEARVSQTLAALDVLTALGFVSPRVRDDMKSAYRTLRTLEHRLQMIADEQTQIVPAAADTFARYAAFSGDDDPVHFEAAVEQTLRTVEIHYAALFEDAPSLAAAGEQGNLVFTGTEDDPDTIATLKRMGYADPSMVAAAVRAWHHGRTRATRSNRARQLLTEVMPILLAAFAKTAQPDAAFIRFDRVLSLLPAGVPLLSVFYSNPELLDLVAEIMGDAPRLAEHVARMPALLDYVLAPEFYAAIADRTALAADLAISLRAAKSFEAVLDTVRRWTHDQQFRSGVQALRGLIDPIIAAEHLSDVAEAAITLLVPAVEAEFRKQFGTVPGGSLGVLAYGKLASHELTPASDLDLVFIYDANADAVSTGGAKSFPAPAYYIRLTQRIVGAFTALTREGDLYTVDMRLRPNGDKGPLAISLEAFAKYQEDDAWTWEHLALVRSRVVEGAKGLAAKIDAASTNALAKARDPDVLLCAVADMRARMRKEQSDHGLWDIKRHPGGLIDAEFILHTLVLTNPGLRGTDRHPTAVIRALVAAGKLESSDGDILDRAIALWSRLQFLVRLSAGGQDRTTTPVPAEMPLGLKRKLARIAGVADDVALEALMIETARGVTAMFEKIIAAPARAAHRRLGENTTIR